MSSKVWVPDPILSSYLVCTSNPSHGEGHWGLLASSLASEASTAGSERDPASKGKADCSQEGHLTLLASALAQIQNLKRSHMHIFMYPVEHEAKSSRSSVIH